MHGTGLQDGSGQKKFMVYQTLQNMCAAPVIRIACIKKFQGEQKVFIDQRITGCSGDGMHFSGHDWEKAALTDGYFPVGDSDGAAAAAYENDFHLAVPVEADSIKIIWYGA